jgi:hypothetical protein
MKSSALTYLMLLILYVYQRLCVCLPFQFLQALVAQLSWRPVLVVEEVGVPEENH